LNDHGIAIQEPQLSESSPLFDYLIDSLQQAGTYNKNDQYPPAAMIWTDKERQWEVLIPAFRERLPLLIFGTYQPSQRMGPAYWLRCMIARKLTEDVLSEGVTPIIYLSRISRQMKLP
jgi:hypothetical protein